MGKIVGNFCILFLFFYVDCISAGIRLDIRTTDGIATESVVVGQPFLVEVTIDGVQGSVSAPTIEGLDQFVAKRTGMYMSSINGASTTKYTYQVRIDRLGDFKIGPATLVYQQQHLVSNVGCISVIKDISAQLQNKNNKQSQVESKAFLRLIVDNDHVVVGQKIAASLRFYYQESNISLSNIGQPEIIGFDMKSIGKPVGGTAEINGTHYRYAEWKWDMYPLKSGEFIVPAYNADYEIPTQDNRLMSGLFMLMSMRSDRKRVYSNAVKITVDSLPYCSLPVNAIGVFENITAHIAPPVAKEGEGMVLTIEVNGEGNLSAIKIPELSMPCGLKYYDSNSTVIEASHEGELSKKRFEFIVQGVQEGDWEIPEQSFVYFDIKKASYVTLRTCPLSVSIQPCVNKAHVHSDPLVKTIEKEDEVMINQCILAPLNEQGPWHPVSEGTSLPWTIFYLFSLSPFLYSGLRLLVNNSSRIAYYSLRRSKKQACRRAYKKIKQCAAKEDDTVIYSIFIDLFAVLINQSSSAVSCFSIEKFLVAHGFSNYEIDEWRIFFDQISHAAYAQSNNSTLHELCRMAKQWIDRLKKVV